MKVAEAVESMEAMDVAEAAAVILMEAVDMGTAITPILGPSIIKEETNCPSNPQGQYNLYRYPIRELLKLQTKMKYSTSMRVPKLEHLFPTACLSPWPVEAKAASTAARTVP